MPDKHEATGAETGQTNEGEGAGEAAPNIHEYSVSELSNALKRSVEDAFDRVRVRGEISGFLRARSGHLYMDLKDENAVLNGVCWKGTAARLGFQPEDGLEVVCTGKLSTYPARSRYQIIIESMEPAGAGALMAMFEERKRKLAAEGLFADERKQPIPYLPGVIGVVTSPTGAVIRDILHRLAERFPRRVLVWPVLVQGQGAAGQVAAAIEGFNALEPGGAVPRPDLIIVARGGGSLEDLWAFNEEIVVRAAAASAIPLISAVGHETDTTLIDYASDLRAPTPTAAAEKAVPVLADLKVSVADLERRMTGGLTRRLREEATRLAGLARGLRDPREALNLHQQRIDELAERLPRALAVGIEARARTLAVAAAGLRPRDVVSLVARRAEAVVELARRLAEAARRRLEEAGAVLDAQGDLLASLSYERVLNRGYALVRGADGVPLGDAVAARAARALELQFRDGRVGARVEDGGARPGVVKKAKRAKKTRGPDDQGTLL